MRLSQYKQTEITRNILSDLYDTSNDELDVRRKQIAKENRELYIQPYSLIFAKLPDALLSHSTKFGVEIRYNLDDNDKTKELREEWVYVSDKPIPNPVDHSSGGYYCSHAAQKPHPELLQQAVTLAEDIISLRAERKAMEDYLTDTFNKWSGTIQLRQVWPASLHKYLPAEPPKKPKEPSVAKTKKEAPELTAAPTALNTRLTTNLLEGS